MKRFYEIERIGIDWWRTHDFGDCDTVGRMKDGRWFWAWDTGDADSDGGVITDTLEDLLDEMEGREALQELVKETFA